MGSSSSSSSSFYFIFFTFNFVDLIFLYNQGHEVYGLWFRNGTY